jgi:Uma2 family endonuclease
LDKDRAKASIYQSSGVNEYWILNIGGKCIEQYRFSESSDVLSPVIVTSEMHFRIQIDGQELILQMAELFK